MKVAIITDQHFGARKGSKFLHEYFKKFYDDVFFPYLKKHKIKTAEDPESPFYGVGEDVVDVSNVAARMAAGQRPPPSPAAAACLPRRRDGRHRWTWAQF